jgi:hypothetical protein
MTDTIAFNRNPQLGSHDGSVESRPAFRICMLQY